MPDPRTRPGCGFATLPRRALVHTRPEVVGGGDWIYDITILSPSTTVEVEGVVDLFQDNGSLFPASISAPSIAFVIAPSSWATISTHNKGAIATGMRKSFRMHRSRSRADS